MLGTGCFQHEITCEHKITNLKPKLLFWGEGGRWLVCFSWFVWKDIHIVCCNEHAGFGASYVQQYFLNRCRSDWNGWR